MPGGGVFIADIEGPRAVLSVYTPKGTRYRIPPPSELRRAPAALIPCTQGQAVDYTPDATGG